MKKFSPLFAIFVRLISDDLGQQQMKNPGTLFCFPGSFCPPTYGHLTIVKTIAPLFPEVLILNSTNEAKSARWFTEDECAALWKHYTLPQNVRTSTYGALRGARKSFSDVVMIRGIRGPEDLAQENKVLIQNYERLGISKYFYMVTDANTALISSTKARDSAKALQFSDLAKCVAPGVVTALLERVLATQNLFMVVGRPGGGKSTILKLMTEIDPSIAHINTDDFNHALRPLLEASFPKKDLVEVALNHEAEMLAVISKEWFKLLASALRRAHGSRAILVEVPYGLQPQKAMYRFLGNKVLHIGCDRASHENRIRNRGTPELLRFLETIPDRKTSAHIAHTEKLNLYTIDTGCDIQNIRERALAFLKEAKIIDNGRETKGVES